MRSPAALAPIAPVLVALAALGPMAACSATPPGELDLSALAADEETLVVKVGDPVLALTPVVGGTSNAWTWKIVTKPSSSSLSAPVFGGPSWQFSPDAAGSYRFCATQAGTTGCGNLSAIEHLTGTSAHVHVERERAILDGLFSLAAPADEPVTFALTGGVAASASGTNLGGTIVDDEEIKGPVTDDALGPLSCRLIGEPVPTAVCPAAPGKIPALGDHLHWRAQVTGTVTNETATVAVDADVVPAVTTGPHVSALTLSNAGTHLVATIDPPVEGDVTLELRADTAGFPGGFAKLTATASSTVEGDLTDFGRPALPATPGNYDVVTRVTSSAGIGISSFPETIAAQ